MLRIYPVILELIASLRPVVEQLLRKDADLARQLRRASASIALNTAEGMYSQGRLRNTRYHSAVGSARETKACLEVAVAMGYLELIEPHLDARLREVIGTLVRIVRCSAAS